MMLLFQTGMEKKKRTHNMNCVKNQINFDLFTVLLNNN